jgi:hypothetical protein
MKMGKSGIRAPPFSFADGGFLMATIDDASVDRLTLIVNARVVPLFFQLLGHGFYLNVQTGCSVKELLCNQLGIHEDYLEQRIQSIFLNGKVVDDVTSAIVPEDAAMALSGAMPGLVGAILRSGGFYAPMRRQISHGKDKQASQFKNGKITLKLWNLVVKELGPTFLQQGIWIEGEEIRSFIKRHGEELKVRRVLSELNDKPVNISSLPTDDWKTNLVFLQVKSEQTE